MYAQAALVAHAADKLGVKVVDGSLLYDIASADTKIEQILRCRINNLPVPTTYYSPNYEELLGMTDSLKWPLVLKIVDTHRGIGVFLVNSKEEVRKYFEEKGENRKRDFLLQERVDYVKDYRIIVIGGKVLGAIERIAHTGEFRSNISLGGRAKKVEKIDPKLIEIAEKAANVMHIDIAGVDVIEDKLGNYFIIEINRSPQTKGFEEATGIGTLDAVFKFLKKKLSDS